MSGADPAGAEMPCAAATVAAVPFLESLRCEVEQRRADGGNLAVLLIECGVISRIDAVWGYQVGDSVRGRVAALLRTDVLRPGDFVGDMGRDDFACVLST